MAICAGSDLMHPLGALVTGGVAGALFVYLFTYMQNKTQIDDVLGVWPLRRVWRLVALQRSIFGQQAFWGLGRKLYCSIDWYAEHAVALIGALVVVC